MTTNRSDTILIKVLVTLARRERIQYDCSYDETCDEANISMNTVIMSNLRVGLGDVSVHHFTDIKFALNFNTSNRIHHHSLHHIIQLTTNTGSGFYAALRTCNEGRSLCGC